MNPQTYNARTTDAPTSAGSASWVGPAVVVAVIAVIFLGSRKRDEVAENPLVDLLVLTVGVLAMAHVGVWALTKLNWPGGAKFFTLAPSTEKA